MHAGVSGQTGIQSAPPRSKRKPTRTRVLSRLLPGSPRLTSGTAAPRIPCSIGTTCVAAIPTLHIVCCTSFHGPACIVLSRLYTIAPWIAQPPHYLPRVITLPTRLQLPTSATGFFVRVVVDNFDRACWTRNDSLQVLLAAQYGLDTTQALSGAQQHLVSRVLSAHTASKLAGPSRRKLTGCPSFSVLQAPWEFVKELGQGAYGYIDLLWHGSAADPSRQMRVVGKAYADWRAVCSEEGASGGHRSTICKGASSLLCSARIQQALS